MWESVLPAFALVLVLEGMMPFLSPKMWREAMAQAAQLPDKVLRIMGFCSMLAGVIVLYLVR